MIRERKHTHVCTYIRMSEKRRKGRRERGREWGRIHRDMIFDTVCSNISQELDKHFN